MSDSTLIPWEYGGHTFHVAATMSDAAKDRACATLLSEFDSRRARISQTVSKPSNKSDDSTLAPKAKDPLEGVLEAPVMILCSICSLPVQRTGNRGRPRKTHKECEA